MEQAEDIGCKLPLCCSGVVLLEGTQLAISRIIHDNVNTPETLYCCLNHGGRLASLGDIQLQSQYTLSKGLEHPFETSQMATCRNNIVTCFQRCSGNGLAETTGGPRDEPSLIHC